MNFEEILKSKELINYIDHKVSYCANRDGIEYLKYANVHGLYLSGIIYDYFFGTNVQSHFDYSCFLSFVEYSDSLNFNFDSVLYLPKYKILVYNEYYLDFLRSKQLKLLNFNAVELKSNITNLIKYKTMYKDCFLDIVDIVDYAYNCCDQSIVHKLLTKTNQTYLVNYYNIENNKLIIKPSKYDSVNITLIRYSTYEKNNEIYFLLNDSNKQDKSIYHIIFKYNPLMHGVLRYIRNKIESFRRQYLKNAVDNVFFYYNMFLHYFKLNYIYHMVYCLNLKNDYLDRYYVNDLDEFDLLMQKLNNFIIDHGNLITYFECSLREQIERYDVINYWVEKEGAYIIGVLESCEVYNYENTFAKWVNTKIKKFKSQSEEILVEPLAIKDKYLGCEIKELYTRKMLTEEGVVNDNCLKREYSINEERRIFSLRYQNIRITCELVYANNIWKANQTLGYNNLQLSKYTDEIQRKIKYVLSYLISELTKLYNPKKKNICQL